MGNQRIAQAITALALLLGVVRPLQTWEQLPAAFASHFNAAGVPDAMSDKTQFFVFYAITMGVVILSLVGSAILMQKIPEKYLNLPHKEYWLKSGKLSEVRAKMQGAMWWMCAATMLLSTVVMELVLQANMHRVPINASLMWTAIVAYLVFDLYWLFSLLTSFTPPDATQSND